MKIIFILNIILCIIGILLCIITTLNWIDVYDEDQNYVIQRSSIILRIINSFIVIQISFFTLLLYGIFAWIILYNNINIDKKDFILLYDGGNILNTIKSLFAKYYKIKLLSFVTLLFFIFSFIEDIFYTQSLFITNDIKCYTSNVTLDIVSRESCKNYLSNTDADSSQTIYLFGPKIFTLPFNNYQEDPKNYTIPAIGNINDLTDYDSITYLFNVKCVDAKPKINGSSLLVHDIDNVQYTINPSNNSQVFFDIINIALEYYSGTYFIIAGGYKNQSYDNIFPIKYNNINITVAACNSSVIPDPKYSDDVFDCLNQISAYCALAPASLNMFYNIQDPSYKNFVTEWLIGGPKNPVISIREYERKIRLIHREYIKGTNIGNDHFISSGQYCPISGYKSNVKKWYLIMIYILQLIHIVIIILCYLYKKDKIINDTENLLIFLDEMKTLNSYNSKNLDDF